MLHLVSLRRERIFVDRNDELKYLHQGALGLTSSIEINNPLKQFGVGKQNLIALATS